MNFGEIKSHNDKNEISENSLSSSNDFKDLDLTNSDLAKYMGNIIGNETNNDNYENTVDPLNIYEENIGNIIKNKINIQSIEKSLINNTMNSTIIKK